MTGPDRDELLASVPRETDYSAVWTSTPTATPEQAEVFRHAWPTLGDLTEIRFGPILWRKETLLDPDPRYAEPDELVERRWDDLTIADKLRAIGADADSIQFAERRRRRTFGLPVLLAACALLFALGFLVRGVVGVGL